MSSDMGYWVWRGVREATAFVNFGDLVAWIEQAHGLPFAGAVVKW